MVQYIILILVIQIVLNVNKLKTEQSVFICIGEKYGFFRWGKYSRKDVDKTWG